MSKHAYPGRKAKPQKPRTRRTAKRKKRKPLRSPGEFKVSIHTPPSRVSTKQPTFSSIMRNFTGVGSSVSGKIPKKRMGPKSVIRRKR